MKILFALDRSHASEYEATKTHLVIEIYYERFISDVEMIFEGQKINLPKVPVLYFLTAMQHMLFESYLTKKPAVESLWETGERFSITVDKSGDIQLEIPLGINRFCVPIDKFSIAIKDATMKLLWLIHDIDLPLLSSRTLFEKGSIQYLAVELMLSGKLPPV